MDPSTAEEHAPCNQTNPCESINHAVNRSAPGDLILIAASPTKPIPSVITSLTIPWSLTFRAQSYPPVISCSPALSVYHIEVLSKDKLTQVSFDGVTINGCSFGFRNASGRFNQTGMNQVNLRYFAHNHTKATILDSTLNNTLIAVQSDCSHTGMSKNTTCNFTTGSFHMENTIMSGNGIGLSNVSDVDVTIRNTVFYNFNSQMKFSASSHLNVEIHNMSLAEFISPTGALVIDCPKGNLTGSVTDSVFMNNYFVFGGALSVAMGNMSSVDLSITGTTFFNNTGETAGCAVNLDLTEPRKQGELGETLSGMRQNVRIHGCNFTRNEDGESAAAVFVAGGNVTITNSTFAGNVVTTKLSVRTKSAERKGAGGAIYGMSMSNINIDDCYFHNNSANWFGGAIAGAGAITITNTYFESSHQATYSTLGEVLYLSGAVKIGNLSFNILRAERNIPLIWYSSNEANILQGVEDGYLDFHCPTGSQFRNDTLPELDKVAAYKDLFYFCEPCKDNTYSLHQGYRMGPLDEGVGNWSSDFQCLPCAYGGVCKEGTIKSQYNFWGHTRGHPSEVTLMLCPENYCCEETSCETYDKCAPNRTGTLCGRCEPGTSEKLYTTECVDDSKCRDTWIFAVDIASSIVTVFFFLYQLEIVGLACKYLFWADVSESDDPTFAGYIKSVFYFYQTIDLLKVQENQASRMVGIAIQPIISYLLSFKSIAVVFGACPFPGTSPVTKTILKSMPTIYVLSFLGILTAIYILVSGRKKKEPSSYLQFQRQASTTSVVKRSFASRLAAACLSYFLFNYISISNMTFTLLACVPVGGQNVLYIDGTVQCIQPWQAFFIMIAIVHVCPFFMAVIASRSLYDKGLIGTRQFFASYFIPLPMLIYWGVLHFTKWKATKGSKIEDAMDESASLAPRPSMTEDEITKANILGIIEQPFINETNAESARYWEGILIFRRLVLSAVAAFTTEPLLSITFQTITCFAFLLWHIHIRPFGSRAANYFETVSLSILTVVATCHIIQATLLSAGIPAMGPSKTQIFITDWIEWILVNLFPMLLGLALVVFIIVRIFMCCGSGCKYLFVKAKEGHESRNRSQYSSAF